MRPIELIRPIQTGIILLLALATPVVAVLDERFWFEKRVVLAGAAVILLALLAARVWTRGWARGAGEAGVAGMRDLGWALLGAALLVAAVLPPGRVANLATPDLWVGLGAVTVGLIGPIGRIGHMRWRVTAAVAGVAAAAAGLAAGIGRIGPIGHIKPQAEQALQLLRQSPIWGEFREFRVAQLGVLQIASGLGILGLLGVLALTYQLGLKSAKAIWKSSNIWQKLLNLLVLVLLAGFLLLPYPALMLWPLAVAAGLACGVSTAGVAREAGGAGTIKRFAWAGLVGLLVVVILGSSYGLGRAVWGEVKFREALAAANKNEGIATYYALLEAIKRNPYEVRYRLLASQIDLALANSIATQAQAEVPEVPEVPESTPTARMTTQDQNNIMILIQQAVIQGKRAVQLDPENSLLWQNLASIYRSLGGVATGAEDWALKSYQRAAELAPKDPSPWVGIGEIHYLAGNFEGAREAFEKAAELGPQIPLTHYNLAVAYNALSETDKAVGELEKVLGLLPADSPDREQAEKDLAFLEGQIGPIGPMGPMGEETEELKEATSSAEVEAPPPPVGPEEATESGKPEESEVPEGLEE